MRRVCGGLTHNIPLPGRYSPMKIVVQRAEVLEVESPAEQAQWLPQMVHIMETHMTMVH